MKSAIAYTRVSTDKQGRSGLGLEAQMAAVVRFAEAGRPHDRAETFAEIETGKGADALDRDHSSGGDDRSQTSRLQSSWRSSTGCRATSTSSRA